MRTIKHILCIALALLIAAKIANTVYQGSTDKTEAPRIYCAEDLLAVSSQATEMDLLQGMTASDAQDGDLTKQIVVAGISKLISNNTAKVTYLVFDSDNNMGMYVRKIQYTDYEKPRFYLDPTKPLVFSSVEEISLLDRITAIDMVDGNVTSRVRVSTLANTDDTRVYDVTVQITNSLGDTPWLKLQVLELPTDPHRPTLRLKEYLIYLNQGEAFDPSAYVGHCFNADGTILNAEDLTVSGQVNTSKPGEYRVTYTHADSGSEGIAILTVVVM